MIEALFTILIVLVILGVVVWGIQQIDVPMPPWGRGIAIAICCFIAAAVLYERLL